MKPYKLWNYQKNPKIKQPIFLAVKKQRVCIARAIVNKPKIIFADEPTGNLDSTTGQKVADLLFDLNKNEKITLVIVTHDPELADRCDRQIHIKDGLVIEEVEK